MGLGSSKYPCAQSPIRLRYPGLPTGAAYSLAASGLGTTARFNVTVNGARACSGAGAGARVGAGVKPDEVWRCEIPSALTAPGGDLLVAFESDCCAMQVAEVWLRRR